MKEKKLKILDDSLENEILNTILSRKEYRHITFDEAIGIAKCISKLIDNNILSDREIRRFLKPHKLIIKVK